MAACRQNRASTFPDYREFLRQVEIPEVPIRTFFADGDPGGGVFHPDALLLSGGCGLAGHRKIHVRRAVHREPGADLSELKRRLDAYTDGWKNPKNDLNRRRSRILQAVTENAQAEKGPVHPERAHRRRKDRHIHGLCSSPCASAGPAANHLHHSYTSILEQTADAFSKIFGSENVLTHYANVEFPAMRTAL